MHQDKKFYIRTQLVHSVKFEIKSLTLATKVNKRIARDYGIDAHTTINQTLNNNQETIRLLK